MASLSPDQERALNRVMAGHNLFITGPGGTGKTHLIRRIVRELRGREDAVVVVTAMTGCAAVLLRDCGAKTIHSWGGLGLGDRSVPEMILQLRKMKPLAKRWREVTTLILDEVSMLTGEMLTAFDSIARALRRSTEPFGGIQFIAVGDFQQLPPVLEASGGGGGDEVPRVDYAFESDAWWRIFPGRKNQVVLHHNFRQSGDAEFQGILNAIRTGDCTPQVADYFHQLVKHTRDTTSGELIERDDTGAEVTLKPTRLFPLRGDADRVNRIEIAALKEHEEMRTFEPETVVADGMNPKTAAVKKAGLELDKQGNQESKLTICKGSQVMVTVNIDFETGLVNGAQGVVVGWEGGDPVVAFGPHRHHRIRRHLFQSDRIIGMGRRQYPLRLCWAATIHKMQGQTLDFVEVDVGSRVFEQGQTYVALSRAKTSERLRILEFSGRNIKAHPRVKEFQEAITPKTGKGKDGKA